MKSLLRLFVFCSFCCLAGCTDEDKIGTYADNFDALWDIIDTRYCYLESKNIDWKTIGDNYRPKAIAANSQRELFDVMASMLDSLKDGHVNLYSHFDISRTHSWYENYPKNFNTDIVNSSRYLGRDHKIAGGLKYAWIADGQVGYIYYGSFSNGFSTSNLKAVFDYFYFAEGLIIDVRENGGGSLTYSDLLAACFFTEEQTTGYMRHKTGPKHNQFSNPIAIKANPKLTSAKWDKPVVIITNRYSYSATNDFVCKMQYAPSATILGGKTGGGGGMPLSSELPIGWSVRFSACPMFDADMNDIEGGIYPDVPVDLQDSDVAQGKCTLIEAALDILLMRNINNEQLKIKD